MVGDVEDRGGDVFDAQFEKHTQACTQGDKTGHVVRATFVTCGGRFEVEFDVAEIGGVDNAVPADTGGGKPRQAVAADVGDAGTFGGEQPLVAIGSEAVDLGFGDVDREDAQGLDGVEKKQGIMAVGDFGDRVNIAAATVGVADPTDADNARARVAVAGELVEIDVALGGWHPTGFDAEPFEVHPGVKVRGEFVVERDDVVARLPVDAFGNEIDTGGGVGEQGDFVGVGVDQLGGGGAGLAHLLGPIEPDGVAFVGGLLAPGTQRFLRRARDRRHGGMVEIGPFLGNGHLAAKTRAGGGDYCWIVGHGKIG